MITAQELRIGNIMKEHYTGKIISVIELTEKSITFSDSFIGKWQAEALEISEEILLKVGFEKSTGEDQRISYIDEIFWIPGMYFLEFDGFWHFYHLTDEDTYWEIKYDVKYIHQLQNLYFALTGEELDVSKLI